MTEITPRYGTTRQSIAPSATPIAARESSGRWRQFNLGTHKVQQLKGAKSIVLPAHWCRSRNLQKGDSIDLFLLPDGNLLLKPTISRTLHGCVD